MPKILRPMLASAVDDLDGLRFPLIASPKLDGIRCLKVNGHALSRSLKPIRNDYARTTLEELCPDGIDGELMAGDTFQACSGAIASFGGNPKFVFWVFDFISTKPYQERLVDLNTAVSKIGDDRVKFVPVKRIENLDELLEFEDECLTCGFEGVMLRDPNGPYKFGRSTVKEGWLLKLKRFCDSEAIIVGFEELMYNRNEARKSKLWYTIRSSEKSGKFPAGTLGAFIVTDDKFPGIEFRIGSGEGLTAKLRQTIWDNREAYVGKLIVYRYQKIGTKNAPRIPIWHGFRDETDLD